MKTTVNINLNGMSFVIDEDAYQKLQTYTNELKAHYANESEIVDDIEARMAELFSEYLSKLGHQVISADDVNRAIEQLGHPDQMDNDAEKANPSDAPAAKTKKKLYRDSLTGFIGGVSSGLAEFLGIDVVLVRLIWVILFFALNGIIAIAYILFWIITPDAKSPSQRLEMKGMDCTAENIQNESEYVLNHNGQNDGCVSVMGKGCLFLTALLMLVPVLLIVFIIGAVLFGLSVPMLAGLDTTLVVLALIAIIVSPIVALVFLAVSLKNREKYSGRTKAWVYSILAVLFIAGMTYFVVNKNTIMSNANNWGESLEKYADRFDNYVDDDFDAVPDSFRIVLKTNYCGDYKPAVSGTSNRWRVKAMVQSDDSTWVLCIPSDEYNEIKFQDTEGDWSNELEWFDDDTQSWKKFDNIHLGNNPEQIFDFLDANRYRWIKCKK